jgi:hypothetical protein
LEDLSVDGAMLSSIINYIEGGIMDLFVRVRDRCHFVVEVAGEFSVQ